MSISSTRVSSTYPLNYVENLLKILKTYWLSGNQLGTRPGQVCKGLTNMTSSLKVKNVAYSVIVSQIETFRDIKLGV